jgi:hypothetical protein
MARKAGKPKLYDVLNLDHIKDDDVVKMQQSFGRGEPGLRIGTKRKWQDFRQKIRDIGDK